MLAAVLARFPDLGRWRVLASALAVGVTYSALLHGLSVKVDLLGRSLTIRPMDLYDRLRRQLSVELGYENFRCIDMLVAYTLAELEHCARTIVESHLGDGDKKRILGRYILEHSPRTVDYLLRRQPTRPGGIPPVLAPPP